VAELKPVQRGGRWRIQISWPDYNPRFFGDFDSEAEAARWIKEHSWLTPDAKASVALPGRKSSTVD
jgi:hypothetical protein